MMLSKNLCLALAALLCVPLFIPPTAAAKT